MRRNLAKKESAIRLRKKGKSIRDIEINLGIARSTLSPWLKNIQLSKKQKQHLHKKWLNGLVKARLKSSKANKKNKIIRMEKIKSEVKDFIQDVKIDKKIGELIFAIFYLAEGAKRASKVEIANTNPKILSSLWKLFYYLYTPDKSRIRCYLHLRMDQSEEKLKNYWSKVLNIPKSQFIKSQFDKRTIKPSYRNYRGVCTVYYCDTNLQKRIVTIGEEILHLIANS